jgi:hypothetical protein
MPNLVFSSEFQKYVGCCPAIARGSTVREMLYSYLGGNERVKGYLFDDQGTLRHRLAIYVDGKLIRDRENLSDAVRETSTVYIMAILCGAYRAPGSLRNE